MKYHKTQLKVLNEKIESVNKQKVRFGMRKHRNSPTFPIEGYSLCCFSPTNKFRVICANIVRNTYFELLTLLIVIFNTLILILDEPSLNEPYTKQVIDSVNFVVLWWYIFEVLIRILAQGFTGGSGAFLRDTFNVFDFILVILISTIMILEYQGWNFTGDATRMKQFTTTAKAMKMLRPLRLARTPALRDTLGSLISAMPNLINAWAINILFIYIFGLLGVHIMCGKVSNCANEVYRNKKDCLAAGQEWVTPPQNYNNIFAAMRTFFEIQTL